MASSPFAIITLPLGLAIGLVTAAAAFWTNRVGFALGFVVGAPLNAGFTYLALLAFSALGSALRLDRLSGGHAGWQREVVAGFVTALSFALFALSLLYPAFHTYGDRQWHGAELFGIGPVGALVLQFGWYANGCLFAAYYLAWRQRYGVAAIAGCCAALLASTARSMTSISNGSADLPILEWHVGFDLWRSSCLLAVLGFGLIRVVFPPRAAA